MAKIDDLNNRDRFALNEIYLRSRAVEDDKRDVKISDDKKEVLKKNDKLKSYFDDDKLDLAELVDINEIIEKEKFSSEKNDYLTDEEETIILELIEEEVKDERDGGEFVGAGKEVNSGSGKEKNQNLEYLTEEGSENAWEVFDKLASALNEKGYWSGANEKGDNLSGQEYIDYRKGTIKDGSRSLDYSVEKMLQRVDHYGVDLKEISKEPEVTEEQPVATTETPAEAGDGQDAGNSELESKINDLVNSGVFSSREEAIKSLEEEGISVPSDLKQPSEYPDGDEGKIQVVMESFGKSRIDAIDYLLEKGKITLTAGYAEEKIAYLGSRQANLDESEYQQKVSYDVLKNLTSEQIKEVAATNNKYGDPYLETYTSRLSTLGYDKALSTLKGYGLSYDESIKILDAVSISKAPASVTPPASNQGAEVTPAATAAPAAEITPTSSVGDIPPASTFSDKTAGVDAVSGADIPAGDAKLISDELTLITGYISDGSKDSSKALAKELLGMDDSLLTKIFNSYNASTGKDFATDIYNFYMNTSDNKNFGNFTEQMELAQKLFPDKTGTLSEEQTQQALDVAQDCLDVIQVNNGIWADENKESFINGLKGLTPEQIALVQQTFDSKLGGWYPVVKIPGTDKYTNEFKFSDMLTKYLSENWGGGFKSNNQDTELMKLLAQSGIVIDVRDKGPQGLVPPDKEQVTTAATVSPVEVTPTPSYGDEGIPDSGHNGETAEPSATPAPTEMPKAEVTPTATPAPTEMPKAEVTPTATPAPTEEITAEATPTAAPAATTNPALLDTEDDVPGFEFMGYAEPTEEAKAEVTPTATPAPTEEAKAEVTPAVTPAPTEEITAEATPTAAPAATTNPALLDTEDDVPGFEFMGYAEPTEEAKAEVTPTPTPAPTETPKAEVTPTPTPAPTETPKAEVTATPTPTPTAAPAADTKTSDITPEEAIIIEGKLDLINGYISKGGGDNSRALAKEVLAMDNNLLAKVAKLYNANTGKDFASDVFKMYMDTGNDNHKFKNFENQLALAKKLFPVQTGGTLTDEQKQQSLDIAQKYLGIAKVHNGIWADNNKEDFINSLKSLTPEQLVLVQQTFDSEISKWDPPVNIPGMDKDSTTFRFSDMVVKYLSKNWEGAFKWNDQNPDLIRLLAQSGII